MDQEQKKHPWTIHPQTDPFGIWIYVLDRFFPTKSERRERVPLMA